MNLRTIYDKISAAAVQADPNVGDIYYGDIYYLNHIQTVKYPAVVVTSGAHQADIDDYFFGFRFNIFYVERLLDNHSNKIDIHANGINFLNSLLKHLDDEFIISNYDIQCFNERFNDMCAGAFTNVLIKFPIDQCYEIIDANPPTPPEPTTDDDIYVCDWIVVDNCGGGTPFTASELEHYLDEYYNNWRHWPDNVALFDDITSNIEEGYITGRYNIEKSMFNAMINAAAVLDTECLYTFETYGEVIIIPHN